jgi:hypothetical protein
MLAVEWTRWIDVAMRSGTPRKALEANEAHEARKQLRQLGQVEPTQSQRTLEESQAHTRMNPAL